MPSKTREASSLGKMLKVEDLHSPHCTTLLVTIHHNPSVVLMWRGGNITSSEFHRDLQAFPCFLVKDEGGRNTLAVQRYFRFDLMHISYHFLTEPSIWEQKCDSQLTVPLVSICRIKRGVGLILLESMSKDHQLKYSVVQLKYLDLHCGSLLYVYRGKIQCHGSFTPSLLCTVSWVVVLLRSGWQDSSWLQQEQDQTHNKKDQPVSSFLS